MKTTELFLDEPLGDVALAEYAGASEPGSRRKAHQSRVPQPSKSGGKKPQAGPLPVEPLLGTRRVMVPTDFSPASSAAIRCAHRMATELRGELLVLYVGLPINHHDASINDKEAQRRARELYRRAEKLLAHQLKETIGAGGATPVQVVISEGFAYECIVKEATKHGAEFIVMSPHGHTDDRNLLLGPTAESVLRHAECPVVLVNS